MPKADYMKNLGVIKVSLRSIGFSEEAAEQQISDMGKIITMAIIERLFREKGDKEHFTPQNIKEFLSKNFTPDYLQSVMAIESDRLIEGYLKEVSQTLSAQDKEKLYSQVRST